MRSLPSFDQLVGVFNGEDASPPSAASDPDAILAAVRLEVRPDATQSARERFARGFAPTHYKSRTSAYDVVALVEALGFDRYNLSGISYDAGLALVLERDHAESGLRCAVLESTYPPNHPSDERTPASPSQVVLPVFAICALGAA